MHHALGFSRRARGIEDKERILGLHHLGLANALGLLQQGRQPEVPALPEGDLRSRALHQQDLLNIGA